MFLAGLLSVAVLLTGTMANDWTVNGQLSSFGVCHNMGLCPHFIFFVGIAILGICVAIWGVFEKEK